MRVAILGAGISGLTTAHHLGKLGIEAKVFEARDRPGGNVHTETLADCQVEWGPNGFLDNVPATLDLVDDLGLRPRLIRAREHAARRFVWRDGALRLLPSKPQAFLFGDSLPLGQRLRVLREPWVAQRPGGGEESVYDFAARRLGPGAADILVDAFVTGIYAGDPKRLSVDSAFPKLRELERDHGSLIKGSIAKKREGAKAPVLHSFDDGLGVIIDALAERADVSYNQRFESLEPLAEEFDHVVCTIPAPRAAELVPTELAEPLRRIPAVPVVVVIQVFDTPFDIPEGFGFLVPQGQGLRLLGTLYDSMIFDGRSPPGKRVFRTLLGGRRDPEILELNDGEICEVVARELHQVWGTYPEPHAVRVIRWPRGICQYELGHAGLIESLEDASPPWLRFAGSSYRGVAFNACIDEARSWSPPVGVRQV